MQALCWASGPAVAPCSPVRALLGRHAIAAAAGKTSTAVATHEGDLFTWETKQQPGALNPSAARAEPSPSFSPAVGAYPLERLASSSLPGTRVCPASPPSVGSLNGHQPPRGGAALMACQILPLPISRYRFKFQSNLVWDSIKSISNFCFQF